MGKQKKLKALITASFSGEGLDILKDVADISHDSWLEYGELRIYGPDELAERVKREKADILICEADFCMGAVLDLPLIVIGSTRGDPSNVDVKTATEKGIPVLHAPGRNADAVAELTVGLIFAARRHIIPADQDLRHCEVFKNGTIPFQRYRGWEVNGKTIGIIGLGAIGRAVRWRMEGLGMKVISYDPHNQEATHTDLNALLAESDIVSMHASPVPDTLGMMGEAQFAHMKKGAVYINTARAALHDLDALTAALKNGQLSAIALDHFDGEQLPANHPLLSMENAVLTPHIGGATYDTEFNHSKMIAEDIVRVLHKERPRFIANPEVLDRVFSDQ